MGARKSIPYKNTYNPLLPEEKDVICNFNYNRKNENKFFEITEKNFEKNKTSFNTKLPLNPPPWKNR